VFLEYLADARSDGRPVLLTYGSSATEAAVLQATAEQLASNKDQLGIRVDELPGFRGVDGCSLLAEVGPTSLGVFRADDSACAFRAVFDPAGWRRVVGLLEPFVAKKPTINPRGFQYLEDLDESGHIDWIISGSRAW
jgi:hypothetical protein